MQDWKLCNQDNIILGIYVFFSCTSSMVLAVSLHHFGPDWNISNTIGWIVMKFCADVHRLHTINPNVFFLKHQSWGWHLWFRLKYLNDIGWIGCEICQRYSRPLEEKMYCDFLTFNQVNISFWSNTLIYDHIPAKHMTSPSAVLCVAFTEVQF